jgi:hypothetical protein
MLWETMFIEQSVLDGTIRSVLAHQFNVAERQVYMFGAVDELAYAQLPEGPRLVCIREGASGEFEQRLEIYADSDPERVVVAGALAAAGGMRVLFPDSASTYGAWVLVAPNEEVRHVEIDEELLDDHGAIHIL